jgi:Zinc finger, C2H2 type
MYGCEDIQFVKAEHFIDHVGDKHPEQLEEAIKIIQIEMAKADVAPKLPTRIFHCDKCEYSTLKKSALTNHMEAHFSIADRKVFKCLRCSKFFNNKSSLKLHLQTFHEITQNQYKCPRCPKISFKELGELNEHVALTHNSRKSLYKCKQCDIQFLKRFMLVRHQIMVHKVNPNQTKITSEAKKKLNAEKKFKCFCGKEFPYKARLLMHEQKHDPSKLDASKKFKCPLPQCIHSFTQRYNLLRHQVRPKILLMATAVSLIFHRKPRDTSRSIAMRNTLAIAECSFPRTEDFPTTKGNQIVGNPPLTLQQSFCNFLKF